MKRADVCGVVAFGKLFAVGEFFVDEIASVGLVAGAEETRDKCLQALR